MLTYQLHTRVFQIEGGGQFQFPNTAVLEVKFSPGSAFGTEDRLSRTLVRAREATVMLNANTGRWLAQSRPPLERLEVVLESPTSLFSLHGDELRYEFQCSSIDELEGTIAGIKWILPPLLNLEFSDPPIIEYVRGSVGQTNFRWEHRPEEWRINIRTVTPEKLEKHLASAWENILLFNGIENRRLAAALTYFHVALRLCVSGDSPWEFMAESILNYAKCLEILFVTSENSRDDIRRELNKLSYTAEEIEGDFVPILVLRSWIDVAHPRVAIFKSRDLKVLYRYMAMSEGRFRTLLTRVLSAVGEEHYHITQDTDLSLNAEEQRGVDRLVNQMKGRLGVLADTLDGT
ncbi:MAG: hypothetical protein O7C73_02340 [Nitrospirae bacterium]|nr:hypothetical protein [Nitrospirota bacterium]